MKHFWRRMILVWLLLASLAVALAVGLWFFSYVENSKVKRQPRSISPSPMGVFTSWVAISGAEHCTNTPRRILEMNGTIADVTVATMLCQCVTMPQKCGLGGGSFAVYYNRANQSAVAFNAREWAPQAAWTNMYIANRTLSSSGFLACGVPGELMGYRRMLDHIGTNVPWAELFKDAERLARDGFPVSPELEKMLKKNEPQIISDDVLCNVFCSHKRGENRSTMTVNETLRNPVLAHTLAIIAREGSESFYGGSVGQMLVDDIQRKGGMISLPDLTTYSVAVEPALRRVLRDNVSVLAPPPPAGGILTEFMIAVMDSYRDPSAPAENSLVDDDTTIHRLIELSKFAFAMRMEMGDPNHIDITAALRNLSSSSFLSEVRSKIKGSPYSSHSYYGLRYQGRESKGSSQFVVLMPNGDALALMSTLNKEFGALAMSQSTGVLLNNQMDDFATPGTRNSYGMLPSPTNYIRPRKRPTSSMSPLIVAHSDGNAMMVASASGAFSICTGLAQVVMRALWMNHTIKEAIDAPRVHHQMYPSAVQAEKSVDHDILHGLLARGHKVEYFEWYGQAIAILRRPNDTHIYGAYDSRALLAGGMDGD
ncbi:glutathione hydrolase 1 proenzyme-like [Amblyomma americanum]